MKYFSLFSGIGGFELGIENSYQSKISRRYGLLDRRNSTNNASTRRKQRTWKHSYCIGFSEIDKYAIQIYKKHFPTHKEYGDVTNIQWSNVPDFELLCGGFPCQSFSIAGKRGGFNDTRGTLFFEIARVAQEKQPRLLFLENVKGLLSHDKGRTFGTILNTLDELGYDLQWQVLNSKNFGVPQNRERVFIIGHLRGTRRPEVFFIEKSTELNFKSHKEFSEQISNTLRTNYGGGYSNETYTLGRKESYAIDANYHKGTNTLEKGRRQMVLDGKIRRLTPTECERLQGFPDGWTSGISDTQRYKCLGNAVTVNVIEAIIKKMKQS